MAKKMKLKEYTRTCLACPAQWEGYLTDGTWIYVRCRWDRTRVDVGQHWNTLYSEDKDIHRDKDMRAFLRRAGIDTSRAKFFWDDRVWARREALAIFMHNEYEKLAKKAKWKTQEECRVKYGDLSPSNRKVVVGISEKVLEWFRKKSKIVVDIYAKEEAK